MLMHMIDAIEVLLSVRDVIVLIPEERCGLAVAMEVREVRQEKHQYAEAQSGTLPKPINCLLHSCESIENMQL